MKNAWNGAAHLARRIRSLPPPALLAALVAAAMALAGIGPPEAGQAGPARAEREASVSPAEGLRELAGIAAPVLIVENGTARMWFTGRRTAGEALRELGISVSAEDTVVPAPDTALRDSAAVWVVRPRALVVEREESIPHETVRRQLSTLPKGKEIVMQEGRDGRVLKRVRLKMRGGSILEETVLEETVLEPPVPAVVAVGTRNAVVALSASSPDVETVTRQGITFGVKKVLDNVTLTAYHAGVESTGKTEGHPQYGITYTGTYVVEGRTIAVDPDVIPLGWWVYIEGIGFRRAEDTGSAVRGKKIDLYMEDEERARQFGLKRGYRVYLIGPEMPAP